MNRTHIVIATGCLVLATAALWLWLYPTAPGSAPVFNWKQGGRYELVVNPATGPALQAGTPRVRLRPPEPPRYSSAALSRP